MCENNSFRPFTICCGNRLATYKRPAVMGILNATPDSFYDGGRYCADDQIVERAGKLFSEGADIVDIGVVSTRPGAVMLPPAEEANRLAHVVGLVRREFPKAILSADTCYSLPARAAVDAGVDIINDIGGGDIDSAMFDAVSQMGVPYVLMHNPFGTTDNPTGTGRITSEYTLSDFALYMSQRIDRLHLMGVRDVIIDPGFGFSKSLDGNYRLLADLPQVRKLFPDSILLVALSRKSMIYKLLGTNPDDALTGTIALHASALMSGAQILRVHDVKETVQTIKVIEKLVASTTPSACK